MVGMNVTNAHMDTKIWGDPTTFRPERFLDEKMNIINSEKLFAFGAGDIICYAEKMLKHIKHAHNINRVVWQKSKVIRIY